MYRDLIADQQEVVGTDHPHTLASRSLLARVTSLLGQHRDAEEMGTSVCSCQATVDQRAETPFGATVNDRRATQDFTPNEPSARIERLTGRHGP